MKVYTQGGTFEISVKDGGVEKDCVMLNAQMGVWNASIVLSDDDLWFFVRVFFRPSILLKVLKLPFRSLFKNSKKQSF